VGCRVGKDRVMGGVEKIEREERKRNLDKSFS
jgi:hypothetical protein